MGRKKTETQTSAASSPSVSQQNTQTQTQNVYLDIPNRENEEEKERKEHERRVFEYIKQQHEHRPSMMYLVQDVASAVSLNFWETDQALKRLFSKDRLYRSTIDAAGDFVYWYRGPD